jgi:arylsulfatase A-like enzyme
MTARAVRQRAALLAGCVLAMVGALAVPTVFARETPRAVAAAPSSIPARAPNILLVMTDDVGFAAGSTFGGPIETPALDSVARTGLVYNRFHTAAMCSPSRAALLTGRNHHTVGTGTVVDLAIGDPGYNSIIPRSAGTIAQVLKNIGYQTAFFGKNHNTPDWEQTEAGPFDRWPTGLGFDYFYGFMGGSTDQIHPALIENTRLIEPPKEPGYLLDTDLANRAVSWLGRQSTLDPNGRFFLYLASGTAHSPHQAPKEWLDRLKGKFDAGWDKVREATFARQKRLGIIPADATLTPRDKSIPAWESLTPSQKAVAARLMEAHAAQLAYFDAQFGRILDELKRSGQDRNTLIIFVQGDNGASGEGGVFGSMADTLNPPAPGAQDFAVRHIDDIGGATLYTNYPTGWAWAMNTPFRYTKQVASHLGGTRNGVVIRWPGHAEADGRVRDQYAHLIDIAPTIYEAVGITPPKTLNGVRQMPLEGISLGYTFKSPDAASRRRSQYFEMVGNRGWYEDGWLAVTTPGKLPWVMGKLPDPNSYGWELYNLDQDYSQSRDLAAVEPKRLAAMRARFQLYAAKHQLLPISNDLVSRMPEELRPYRTNGGSSFDYFPSDTRLTNQSFPDVKNRPWSIDADVINPPGGGNGAIITQGGWFGGWGLFMRNGAPRFVYRASIFDEMWTISGKALQPGRRRIELRIVPLSGRLGGPVRASILVDGVEQAQGEIGATVPLLFPNEGVGIGREFGTGLERIDATPDRFDGVVRKVTVNVSPREAAPGH